MDNEAILKIKVTPKRERHLQNECDVLTGFLKLGNIIIIYVILIMKRWIFRAVCTAAEERWPHVYIQ